MSLREEQSFFLRDVNKLFVFVWENGWEITGGELLRTPEMQKIYVDTGKSKTLQSNHLVKCAIDLNFFKNGALITTKSALQEIGDYWESLSGKNRWGGNFRTFIDCPHFERNQYPSS